MISYHNRQVAHHEIDHIFQDLFPSHGMTARPSQIELSHKMLDAMIHSKIALSDAGTGNRQDLRLSGGWCFFFSRVEPGEHPFPAHPHFHLQHRPANGGKGGIHPVPLLCSFGG